MFADLCRVVLEHLQPQKLIVIERPGGLRDLQPIAINVERLRHIRRN